jgi:arabinogalactan endo-1,4-beta-galactosidase
VQRYWRHKWGAKDFFDYAKESGFDWVKTSVTMLSSPELAATPPNQWDTLAWQNTFWSSREFAAETLKQAKARGLRLEVQLFLSPGAANWGNQKGPVDWLSKTPDEIVPLLTQNVIDTVNYFKSQGLNVERYAIGNEVDIGILDFLPNQRIAVPPGVGFTTDMQWMRDNVWPIEAKLLKAAAAGVQQAEPSAKIILHIGGLEFSPGNVFVPAFFQAMHDFGVPFDYGALSHPYATYPWKLDRYPAACWFKRLALSFDRIGEITGKPTMMVEGDYPAATVTGIVAAPMPDFPFTATGQAAWVHQQLRFAAGRPNMAGWHYFYPDMASDVIGNTTEEIPLGAMSVFATSTVPRPALAEFRVNLSIFAAGFE